MRSIRFWQVFPMIGELCVVVGALLAAGVTRLMPVIYESEMIIEVRPLGSEMKALKRDGGPTSRTKDGGSPEYLAKAAEDLRGWDLLGKVVNALQLDRKWKKDRRLAVEQLREAVSVSFLRNSPLVSIRVRDVDRKDACAIATEIGWHFVELRNGLARAELQQRLDKLDRAIRDQEDRVEERRKVLRTILKSQQEVDPNKVEWIEIDGSDTNEEAPGDTIKRGGEPQTYDDAKRDFDTDLKDLSVKTAERATLQADGQTTLKTVLYHEMPRVAEVPVWPDVRLNLVVGMGLGFLLSPAITLLVLRKKSLRAGAVPPPVD